MKQEVRVFQDLDALSSAAAAVFLAASSQAILERGRCLVALSGGVTPRPLYGLLARSPYRELVDWSHLHAFWGDERMVPIEDLENSYRAAHDILLGRVPVPAENIHRMQTELDPESAAADYARVLKEYATPPLNWPRFDLVLLGMGDDGHTASIFPGSPVETDRPVIAVNAHYGDRPTSRVTLTPLVFNSARSILFLVSGKSKSKVVADVLYGKRRPEALPAQRINPVEGEVIWMLDQGAANRP